MSGLESRIRSAESGIDNIPGGSNEVKMFFRENPDDQRSEKWMTENPGFQGKALVMLFGTANLNIAR
jgi:hypothetical protein